MAGGVAVAVALLVAACGGDDGSGDDAGSRPQEAPAGGMAHSTTGAWGSAEPDPAFPPQPDGVPFPGETWPEGDWPDGVDRAAVDAAVDAGFAGGAPQRVRAVLIVHGGEIVYERYSPHAADGPRAVMPGYSMAKSFTSALVGVLARERRIDVEAPAAVPEWRADDDPRHAITVDHLLRMSSGLTWDEGRYPDDRDLTRMIASGDVGAYVAAKDLAHEPGTTFVYNTGSTMLVDRILADEVGRGLDFRAFMGAELLDPIGIARLEVEFDDVGTWLGGVTADTTARNFARLGLLYLRDGVWDGRRVLPDGWVEYSRRPSATNPEYGAGWWLDRERPGVFYAVGILGQVIGVAPDLDLVFVQLATDSDLSLAVSEAILDAFAAV